MADLVVCCPKNMWAEWLHEGDLAGHSASGEEWSWFLGGAARPDIAPGERLYIVAWGWLRGWAPVTSVERTRRGWAICRRGGAVALTIPERIVGFPGWVPRWWDPAIERPFPDWQTAGLNDMPVPAYVTAGHGHAGPDLFGDKP